MLPLPVGDAAGMRVAPRIRVALVQLRPKLGHVQANIARAKELCRKIPPHSVDLVCFPELAFTGYAFPDARAIAPHLEPPRTGATGVFCAALARELGCAVLAGYPERLDPNGAEPGPAGANSAVLFGPDGACIGGTRKTNLYPVDKTWARPGGLPSLAPLCSDSPAGNGFATFTIPLAGPGRAAPQSARVAVGICMDLNAAPPHAWTTEGGPYELADYALAERADALVLLNAWLDSRQYPEHSHDLSTLNFWAQRLRPMWVRNTAATPDAAGRETLVAICNRGGVENDTVYAGCSAVFRMRRGAGERGLLRAALGRREEDVLIWPAVGEGEEEEEEGSSEEEEDG
ncbi:hypothetical protein MIND_00818100 [Mycena indigotica]|uniref:CN hydrolase domain-containing protein n=1 Tax=Mycena indigotica TaxID=2126181 RepID=A0A8H6SI06_9AGAR|nr:uncharacterized protein MIND_00818100 [Mycena indigotica]KAF7298707.1 hypothetical protein MIND_00818100 [Mycena indigotica]